MAEDVFGIVGTTQGGSFRVERVVAEGGFSVVYRAHHGAFRAPVALKCLKIPGEMTAAQREAFLEKFREEAEILFRLSASIPEVVRPLHVDTLNTKDGRFVPFLALEWLEGEALDEILYRRREQGQAPMGLFKLVKLLRPVARGLSRAHRFPGPNGTLTIVHRDIKPENILVALVNGQETVKLLDFGISVAKRVAARKAGEAFEQTPDTMNAFTPRYAAPEQWAPEQYGEAGPFTDVWGLAMTMVEALAGRPVVDGDIEEMRAIVFNEKRRPTPRNEGVVIADELEEVFQKALTIDPRRRTRDIETFWNGLERAMGMQPSFARKDGRAETVNPFSPTSGIPPAPTSTPGLTQPPALLPPMAGLVTQPPPAAQEPGTRSLRPVTRPGLSGRYGLGDARADEAALAEGPRLNVVAPSRLSAQETLIAESTLAGALGQGAGAAPSARPGAFTSPPAIAEVAPPAIPSGNGPRLPDVPELSLGFPDDAPRLERTVGPGLAARPAADPLAAGSDMGLELELSSKPPASMDVPDLGAPALERNGADIAAKPEGGVAITLEGSPGEPPRSMRGGASLGPGAGDLPSGSVSRAAPAANGETAPPVSPAGERPSPIPVPRLPAVPSLPAVEAPSSAESQPIAHVLRTPIVLLAVGLVGAGLDRGLGDALRFGPIRLMWIAMMVLIVGLSLTFWRLLTVESDA